MAQTVKAQEGHSANFIPLPSTLFCSQRYQSREDELQNLEVNLDEHLLMKAPGTTAGGQASTSTPITAAAASDWHSTPVSAASKSATPADGVLPFTGFLTLGVVDDDEEDPENLYSA
jgi:hypothetical protein